MFRMRRFRAFVLVTILTIVSIYELYHLNNWDVPDLDSLSHLSGFRHDADQVTSPPKQAEVPPPPPPASPESHDGTRPPKPAHSPSNVEVPSVSEPEKPKVVQEKPAAASNKDKTSPTAPLDAARTITGEEFLKKQPQDYELASQGQSRLDVKPRPADKPKARWQQQEEHFPVQKIMSMPAGEAQALPAIQHRFSKESSSQKKDRIMKQTAVREAFKHAWNGYKTYALPHDELKPLSNDSADPFNGWGATLVDSLDTLWIMGFKRDFEYAVQNVSQIDFMTSPRKDIPLFETTIRYLGGLLGAYDISGGKYTVLLDKAVELADVIMGAFDTPNRMPMPYYEWAPSYASQPHRSSSHIVMAELGSLAIELTRLSQVTKEVKYYDAVARVTNALDSWQMKTSYPGVWPVKLDSSGCSKPNFDSDHTLYGSGSTRGNAGGVIAKRQADDRPIQVTTDKKDASIQGKPGTKPAKPAKAPQKQELGEEPADFIDPEDDDDAFSVDCEIQGLAHEHNADYHMYSIGAMADSTYEYFPKMHSLLGGRNEQYRSMYLKAADVIRKDFIYRPMIEDEKRDVRFLAKQKLLTRPKEGEKHKVTIYDGTHLGCFVGGMFALGSKMFDIPSDMTLADKLTDGCVWAYESTPLGVMAEEFELTPCADEKDCPWDERRWHDFLDPDLKERVEAVERYNAQQKALADGTTAPAEDGHFSPLDKVKRQDLGDGTRPPSRTLKAEDEHHEDYMYAANNINTKAPAKDNKAFSSSAYFTPKVALSHAKFVAARISEERLPPSYTRIKSPAYKLRPEAIESVFIMYRLTGDQKWRDKGWQMFLAVERASRTASGHATVKDVTSVLGEVEDTMESFWLAETLKYFYLLFEDEGVVSLDDWVLNTEAHPMRLPKAGRPLV